MKETATAIVGMTLALVAAATPTQADELRLRNGDRLTGAVVKLDAGTLTFETAFGELAIPWEDVAAIATTGPLVVTVTGRPPVAGTLAPGAEGRLALTTAGRAEAVALADVVALAPPTPPWVLSGGANAGLVATGGNTDISTLRLDGELVARGRADRLRAGAAVNHAQDRGRDTAENATLLFKYDRFLSDRVYATGDAIFTNDRFRGLDLRSALGAGLGYQLWETPMVMLSVDAGIGYVRENFDTAADSSYAAAREAAKLEVGFGAGRALAFHRHDGYFGLTGDDNLFLRTSNGVRFSLVGGLVATTALDVDYDRSPEPGRETTDRTFSVTFGYRF